MKKIAVLITCHNRKKTTLNCLRHLYDNTNEMGGDFVFDIYVTDDGSTDGTSEAITDNFPEVIIIKGNGSLYWAGGMRTAWDYAAKQNDYDYYIWLNDDTMLKEHAIKDIMDDNKEGVRLFNKTGITTAACCDSKGEFSYGGRLRKKRIIPNGKLQKCSLINGNFTLIPRSVFLKIGSLDKHFTHGIADYSYGLTAIENGFDCWTTKSYLAICEKNECPKWCSPQTPLRERIKLIHSPKGIKLNEQIYYVKKHKLASPAVIKIKILLKVFFPRLFNRNT